MNEALTFHLTYTEKVPKGTEVMVTVWQGKKVPGVVIGYTSRYQLVKLK